jgi:uncharacterized repeat protein (TIGR02543 family)
MNILKQFLDRNIFKIRLVLGMYLCVMVFSPGSALAADPDLFIMKINTAQPGITPLSFTIPTTGGGYNYQVDCEYDGITFDPIIAGQTGDYTCVYAVNGMYDVAIRGDFPRIYFNFYGDRLKLSEIKQWGTSQWTSFNNAFRGATQMTITATDIPDLSNVTDTSSMFTQADSISTYPLLNTWDMSTVTNASYMFSGADLFNQDISGWNTSNMATMSGLFQGTAFNQDISGWDTSSVTNMTNMFSGSPFNQDISGWDVSNVTHFDGMFAGTTAFNQDISGWNTSSAIIMDSMFRESQAFNQDISGWDVSNVTSVLNMFTEAQVFNQNLNGWDTSGFTDVKWMFSEAPNFNGDISAWDTSNITNMSFMFELAPSFNQDISGWDTSNVTEMGGMFYMATLFNQDISGWDTSNVQNLYSMFEGATSFEQNLGSWNVTSLTGALTMFNGVELSPLNYESLLIGWSGQTVLPNVVFDGGNSQYCTPSAQTARNILTSAPNFWTITDGGIGGCVDIIYDGNGNTSGVTPPTQNGVAGGSVTVQNQNTLVKSGYTFVGWNTLANGSGTSYGVGASLTIPSSNLTLFAKWNQNPSGGSSGGKRNVDRVTPVIEPFGASEPNPFLCETYLSLETPISIGKNTNQYNKIVEAVQKFLNQSENEKLMVTGIYDIATQDAVNRFQIKYKNTILSPWGLQQPTGVIFRTTLNQINVLNCKQAKQCPYFTKTMDLNTEHQEALLVKSFLNSLLNTKLDTKSAQYDTQTSNAVHEFQRMYQKNILQPLNLRNSTGLWYESTIKHANRMYGCTN